MPNFYSPTQVYPEDPVLCRVVPIKIIVAVIQFAWILMLIVAFYLSWKDQTLLIIEALSLVLSVITFAGFVIEHRIVMFVHYWICVLGSVVPLGCLVCTFVYLTKALIDNVGEGLAFVYFLGVVVGVAVYFAYTWMCHKLIEAAERKTDGQPEFDTTQGLFQFTERDGGNPRESLLYPKL